MSDGASHVTRETLVSALINGMISLGFFLLVFGFGGTILVWGIGNYAFDFLPQSFAVAFFASFVPSLLTRKALLAGKVVSATRSVPTTGSLLVKSIQLGIAAAIVGAGIWAAVFWASGTTTIQPIPAFTLKIIYGAAMGALVTRRRLQAMLK